jgi:hypothetical protein
MSERMRSMMRALAVAAQGGFSLSLGTAALLFGLRHGIDWDHIAAITDITGSQVSPRKSLRLASLYALGHAIVVLLLGFVAIELGARIPAAVDAVMERLVGATLLLLGFYVFFGLIRHGRRFRMRSRWMLLFSGVRRARSALLHRRPSQKIVISHDHTHGHKDSLHATHEHREAPPPGDRVSPTSSTRPELIALKLHRHSHNHVGELPEDPFAQYSTGTAVAVGMIHGVGAETPTQVLLFLGAVGVGGRGAGIALLVTFLIGLFASNTLIAVASAFGFLGASHNFALYATVAVVTGALSVVLGVLYLFGQGALVPPLLGG